jgi:hypothetical protein
MAPYSLDQWRARGLDQHSVVADPAHGDFSLPPDSPALKLGFRPIDLRQVGPRRPAAERN